MVLQIVPLLNLLKSDSTEEEIKSLLFSFECKSVLTGASDVENFLHNKAIQFEKMDLARTYLVMSTYQEKPYLAGYFSISNKPLVIPHKQYKGFGTSLKKRLMGLGHKTEQNNYEVKGYLIGQLGKNYNEVAIKAGNVRGRDILTLAYSKIREAYLVAGGRILFIECEDHQKLRSFYEGNGFKELENYDSPNNLCLYVKMLKDIE